jgi:hypothetical protein
MYGSGLWARAGDEILPAEGGRVVAAGDTATITILLWPFSGELASRERRVLRNWKLIASDDGSSERETFILHAFQKSLRLGKVKIVDGPRRGAPPNILFLACAENLVIEHYAFCKPTRSVRARKVLLACGLERARVFRDCWPRRMVRPEHSLAPAAACPGLSACGGRRVSHTAEKIRVLQAIDCELALRRCVAALKREAFGGGAHV